MLKFLEPHLFGFSGNCGYLMPPRIKSLFWVPEMGFRCLTLGITFDNVLLDISKTEMIEMSLDV